MLSGSGNLLPLSLSPSRRDRYTGMGEAATDSMMANDAAQQDATELVDVATVSSSR